MHTAQTQRTQRTAQSAKDRGFGGFPMPLSLLSSAINRFFPKFKRQLTRTVTIPVTTSLVSARATQQAPPHAKAVPYISFNAIVGRNSAFHLLTNEQLEELGGVEYRALNALLWLVAGVSLGSVTFATGSISDVYVFPVLFRLATHFTHCHRALYDNGPMEK